MPAPRKYPDELRERAIRAVQTSGRPVAHVARDLGIHTELAQLRKENTELRKANEILKARLGVFREGARPAPHEADAVINHLRDDFRVEPVCREQVLSVSAYNARLRRPKSARRLRDEQLLAKIRTAHAASGETCGARRIRQLRREGVTAARCTIERLMREDGLEGVIRGRRRRTTVPEPTAPRPPDLVNRLSTVTRPNQLWVADLTCVRTWAGWVYAAFVLDVYSRTIVG